METHLKELLTEIESLFKQWKPDPCSVCTGDGKPLSGGLCICDGEGTIYGELKGLRLALYDLDKQRIPIAEVRDILKEASGIDGDWLLRNFYAILKEHGYEVSDD